MDLTPTVSDKVSRLLPRLASDADGEVVATARALCRTLDRAGLDLHDLAARLTEPPRPVVQPRQPPTLFEMAGWLRLHAQHRLTENQRDFVVRASGLLASGRALMLRVDGRAKLTHAATPPSRRWPGRSPRSASATPTSS